jgi:hypothetical protein
MEGKEADEVTDRDQIVIDNEDKYRSRRGPNQEIYRGMDRNDQHLYRWFRVVELNRKDVRHLRLYIRDDTFDPAGALGGRPSKLGGSQRERVTPDKISTSFLNTMRPHVNTASWRGNHKELSGAHHKLGKNVLAWLFEHMEDADAAKLKEALHLNPESQALAVTRLASNLISPTVGTVKEQAISDKRTDDPMNNRDQSLPGQEYLDMMTQQDGNLSPRSQVYSHMAHVTVRHIWERYLKSENQASFKLTQQESQAVISSLLEAEMLNFKLEGGLGIPSHNNGNAWEHSGRYTKKKIPPLDPRLSEHDKESYNQAGRSHLRNKQPRDRRDHYPLNLRGLHGSYNRLVMYLNRYLLACEQFFPEAHKNSFLANARGICSNQSKKPIDFDTLQGDVDSKMRGHLDIDEASFNYPDSRKQEIEADSEQRILTVLQKNGIQESDFNN